MGKAVDFMWSTIQTVNRPLLYVLLGIIWIVSWCGPGHWSADSEKALSRGNNSRGRPRSQPELLNSASFSSVLATRCFQHVMVFSREQARLWHGECWLRRLRAHSACSAGGLQGHCESWACRDTVSPGACSGPQSWPWKSHGRTSQSPVHSTCVKPT